MKIVKKLLIIFIVIGFSGCTKKLSIADFSDDFNSYTSELRIEAILNPTDFMNSVVRVDKTILVTDATLFNGLDDNVSLGNFTFREVINNDSITFSHSAFFPPTESNLPGFSIFNLSPSMFPIGLSQVTVSILDNSYSQYFISSLSLRDEALSNLRDQNGYVILGIAGSASTTTIYVKNIL